MTSPSETRRTILLTGASGVLGTAILRALEPHADVEVIGLVHRRPLAAGRAESLHGDVTKERLGLSDADYRRLAERVDIVICSSGLTAFGAPARKHQALNVDGTQRVVELAAAAGAQLHHISTSYVAALDGRAARPVTADNVLHTYISSKDAADRQLAASGVPHTIHRPSNVIGDSRTGEVDRKEFFPQLAMGLLKGRYPIAPVRPGTVIDMVPQDVCAEAIVATALAGEIGEELWLTYGHDSLGVPDMIDVCMEFAREAGRDVEPPLVFDPDDEAQVEQAVKRLPLGSRKLFLKMVYPRLVQLNDGMSAVDVFPSDLPALRDRYGIALPDLRETARRSLVYLDGAKLLRAPSAETVPS